MESKCITISMSLDGNVTLLYDQLERILTQPKIGKRPIVIVSIVGACRKGKSFILNFFIRYLKNKGYENDSWLGDFSSTLEDGFDWRGGQDADTKGIKMLSEPFIVKKDGEEVAVFLMDTQGLFDSKTEKSENAQIFALSTLLSSIQIFNLTSQIQEDDLEYLEFFIGFTSASKNWIKARRPFQSLLFLVRDWSFPDDNDYGSEGGKLYLQELLDNSKRRDKKSSIYSVREKLQNSFENLLCFLMPYPGKMVSLGRRGYIFKGCLNDVDKEFVQELCPLANLILSPENLVIKNIDGKKASPQLLLNFIHACNETFKSGKLPEVTTMLEVCFYARNMEAGQIAEKCYDHEMQNGLAKYLSDSRFQALHISTRDKAIDMYDKNKACDTKGKSQEVKLKLRKRIRQLYKGFVVQIQQRKDEAEQIWEKNMEREIKSYKVNMKQSHEKHLKKALSNLKTNGTGDMALEGKYLQKLQVNIQDIYNQVIKENEEKQEIHDQKKLAKIAEASVTEYVDTYQTKMKTVV